MLSVLLQTVDFSGLFVLYSILFAIVVLYYLLLSNVVRAFLLVQTVNLLDRLLSLQLNSEQEIHIGSLAFAFLSGKVFLNNVRFRTKNYTVLVLQATIRFNWWYVEVREGEKRDDEKLPCRLSVELVGVEIVVHHNSSTYDHLATLVQHHSHRGKDEHAGSGFAAAARWGKKASRRRHRQSLHGDEDDEEEERQHERALVEELLIEAKKKEQLMPGFYRWFPVTKLTVKSVSLMLGNLKLPNFLVLHLASAQLIHSITPPSSPHCYYQLSYQLRHVHSLVAYLAPNPSYTASEDIVNIKRTLDAEDYFAVAISAFGRFLSEWDTELARMQGGQAGDDSRFMKSWRKGQARVGVGSLSQWSYLVQGKKERREGSQRQDREAEEMKARGEEARTGEAQKESQPRPAQSQREQERRGQQQQEREKEIIFQCDALSLDYSYDITTLLTAYDVAQLRLHPKKATTEAPLTAMKVSFLRPLRLRYGPWIDNQRVLFLSYFKPFDFRNQTVYVPHVGQLRGYASFGVELVVATGGEDDSGGGGGGGLSVLRVPYREASKMRDSEIGSSHSTGWLDFSFQSESSLSFRMDLLPTKAGTTTAVHLTLNSATVTPSFTQRAWLEAEQALVSCEVQYPQQWNHLQSWRIALTLHTARCFFLSAHLGMLTDLLSDWSSYTEYQQTHRKIGGPGLEYFQPSASRYIVTASDYELVCNVNASNVIDSINSWEDNSHIVIRGPDLQAAVSMDSRDWKARANTLSYELHLRNVHAHLKLPLLHPLTDLLETGNEQQLLYCIGIGIRGSRLYHHKYNAEYRDSHSLHVSMEGAELELTGHYLRYLLCLYDNYVGESSLHLSSAAFVLAGYRNLLSHVQALRSYEHSVHNAYETHITLQAENLAVSLPDHMFSSQPSHQPKLRCHELQVQLRSVQQYTDVFLCLTPVTLTVPLPVSPAARLEDGLQSGWNERETCLQLHGLSLSYLSNKGEPPRSIVYRSSMKVQLDDVSAQLLPSQLALVLQSLSLIAQQWADAVDHSKPPVSCSTLMPQIDSNNDTLELITAKRQLTSYLQDLMSRSLADNSIELSVARLRFNLLHPAMARQSQRGEGRLSVTRLVLSRGAQLSSSTLITPQAHSKLSIDLPSIELQHLIAADADGRATPPLPSLSTRTAATQQSPFPSSSSFDRAGGRESWLSVADFRCGAVLTVSDQRADCLSTMRKQQDLVYSQMHQEAASDSEGGYSWHETNATKVPYLYTDEWSSQAAGLAAASSSSLHPSADAYGLTVAAMQSPHPEQQQRFLGLGSGKDILTPLSASPLLSPNRLISSAIPRMRSAPSPHRAASDPSEPAATGFERLRSHAQKRSVQIGKIGFVLPRAVVPLSNRTRPRAAGEAGGGGGRGRGVRLMDPPRAAFQRRQSGMQRWQDSTRDLLRAESVDMAEDEEHKEEEEEEEDVDDDGEQRFASPPLQRLRSEQAEEISQSSFESCQSLSDGRLQELSRQGEQSSTDSQPSKAEDETWEEFRREGQPGSVLVEDEDWEEEGRLQAEQPQQRAASTEPLSSQQPPTGSYAAPAGSLIPPLPQCPTQVSPVPSPALQQYLEHYTRQPRSHSFVLPLHQRQQAQHGSALHPRVDVFNAFASAASPVSPSSSPHSSVTLDSDLAGTAAGAFLVLPIVSFDAEDYGDGDDGSAATGGVAPVTDGLHGYHAASALQHEEFPHSSHRPRPSTLEQMHREQHLRSPHTAAFAASSAPAAADLYRGDELDEEENRNPSFTQTRHVLLEAVRDVSVTVTPAFIVALDAFFPLLQPAHATIEDTLDELHLQFSRAFSSSREGELQAALAREQPFTSCRHVTVSLPSVSVELLQSAPLPAAASLVSSSSSLVYSTILCVDELRIYHSLHRPLPEGFGSTSASAFPSLIDLATPVSTQSSSLPAQPASIELSIAFSRLHLFSSLLNPELHLAPHSDSPFMRSPAPLSAAAYAPISIPPSYLLSTLPAELLSSCLVFMSWEVGATRAHYTRAVDVLLHTHDGLPPPPSAVPAPPVPMRSSLRFTFDSAASAPAVLSVPSSAAPTPALATDPPTFVHSTLQDMRTAAGGGGYAGYPYEAAAGEEERRGSRGKVGKSWSLTQLFAGGGRAAAAQDHGEELELGRLEHGQAGGARHRRVRGARLHMVEETEDADDERDDDSKESRSQQSEARAGYDLDKTDRIILNAAADSASQSRAPSHQPTPLPSPPARPALAASSSSTASAVLQYHHRRRSSMEVSVHFVTVLAGQDAPERLSCLALEWWTASQQLELVRMVEDARQQDRFDRERRKEEKEDRLLSPWNEDVPGPRAPLCLLPLIPGGPLFSARRYRWQTLLSFALQHLQHSRVLDGQRSAAMAFTEQDQRHLLEWYHYQAMQSWSELWRMSKMQQMTEEQRRFLQQQEQEIVDVIAAYGQTEQLILPPSLQRALSHSASLSRPVSLSQLPPSALAPQLHAILQQNAIASPDVNYIMSSAAPLSIAMRKMLKLPVSLMRRLNFKLQRLDIHPAAAAAAQQPAGPLPLSFPASSASAPAPAFDPPLDSHLEYERLFSADKLRTTPLALLSLRLFARLAPQAAKVKAVYGPSQLSPALWRTAAENIDLDGLGSRFDSNHRVMVDEEEQEVSIRVEEVRLRVMEEDQAAVAAEEGKEDLVLDHALTVSRIALQLQSVTTPRWHRPAAAAAVVLPVTASQLSPQQSYNTTPLPTPAGTPLHAASSSLSASARPSFTIVLPEHDRAVQRSPLTPARTHANAQPVSPDSGAAEPVRLRPSTAAGRDGEMPAATAGKAELVRVQELMVVIDCRQLLVEFSPSLHHFLASAQTQLDAPALWKQRRATGVPLSSPAPEQQPAAEDAMFGFSSNFPVFAPETATQRPLLPAPPQATSEPPPLPSPPTSSNPLLAQTFASRRFPLLLPPLILHVHTQCELSTFAFRIRMPDTGSLLLSSTALALCVSRSVPALVAPDPQQQQQAKDGKKSAAAAGAGRTKGKRDVKGRPQSAGTKAAGGGADHRTGSLRKDREERRQERETERKESESSSAQTSELPVTTALVNVEGLDVRLLDAESCALPLLALVGQQPADSRPPPPTTLSRRAKESVLSSLIAAKCVLNAAYTADTSPLSSSPLSSASRAAVAASARQSLQHPASPTPPSHSAARRMIFTARPQTATLLPSPPSASLSLLLQCEQSVLTLPFYELESLYVTDYLAPWRPIIDMLSTRTAASTAAAAVPAAAPARAPAAAAAVPVLPVRVTCQLLSVSLVMLPLPTVMITYHIDRLWLKLHKPRADELVLILAVGEQGSDGASSRAASTAESKDDRKDSSARRDDRYPHSSPLQFRAGDSGSALPAHSHKLTLHSANVRKRNTAAASSSAFSFGGHHTRRPTTSQPPASVSSLASLSSSYGGLGAVLYSRMQFVLDFSLPTLRVSLTVKRDPHHNGVWLLDGGDMAERAAASVDPQLDPAVAAVLMRLSSEQRLHEEDDGDSAGDSGDSDSSDDSSSKQPGKDGAALTPEQAAAVRLVRGVIGVGSMSNQLNESVLNRLLHLQATLNTELNQLVEKVAHYSRSMRAAAAEDGRDSAGRGREEAEDDAASHAAALSDSLWERYCLDVSVVFDDVHVTGGLDASKKTHRNRRNAAHPLPFAASASAQSSAQPGSAVYFDSSWDPMIEVRTGTVTLSLRYTPHLYRQYLQQRQELQQQHQRRRGSGSFSWAEPSADASSASSSAVSDALSQSEVVVEVNCYHAAIELSTSGRERYDAYTILMSASPRRALVQLSTHIRLRLGLDRESRRVELDLSLQQALCKLTAVAALIGSVHALADRYASAYAHYRQEAARLQAEDQSLDFRDPLLSLRQLQAGVWSPRQRRGDDSQQLSPAPPERLASLSPVPSEASAVVSRPVFVLEKDAGAVARLVCLLDSLSDRTHGQLRLQMDDGEIVVLFERPTPAADAEAAASASAQHSDAAVDAGNNSLQVPSIPASPSLHGGGGVNSLTNTPSSHSSDPNTSAFFSSPSSSSSSAWHLDEPAADLSAQPVTMTAVVLSLTRFDLRTDYLPAPAAASSSSSSAAASSSFTSSAFPSYRPVYARQPLNVLHADMMGEGLELSFLTGIPETNNLSQLAFILARYREAATPSPSLQPVSVNDGSRQSSAAGSPLLLPISADSTGNGRPAVYAYNRLLVRSSTLSMRVTLPALSAASVLTRAAGSGVSASHMRDRSREKAMPSAKGGSLQPPSHSRSLSVASSVASASSAASASTASVLSRDINIQVQTSSSGCEIDIDPSLVHHLHDSAALLELLSSVSQEALDEQWTQPSSSPSSRPTTAGSRRSTSPTLPAFPAPTAASSASSTASVSQQPQPATRRSKFPGQRRRTSGEKGKRRTAADGRRRRRRRGRRAEGSTTSWLDEEEDEAHLSDGPEGREARRRYRAKRLEAARAARHARRRSYQSSASPAGSSSSHSSSSSFSSSSTSSSGDEREFISPPSSPLSDRAAPATDGRSSADIVTRSDIIIELELHIAQGRLALYPTPIPRHRHKRRRSHPHVHARHASADSGLPDWAAAITAARSPRLPAVSGEFSLAGDAVPSANHPHHHHHHRHHHHRRDLSPPSASLSAPPVLFGSFSLPTIVCTYLSQHEAATEHVLLLDVTQPPVLFTPAILRFLDLVDSESKRARAMRQQQQQQQQRTPAASSAPAPSAAADDRPGHERFSSNLSTFSRASVASNLSSSSSSASAAPPSPSSSSSLQSFLSDCLAAHRSITVTLRVRPTSLTFRCSPTDDDVFLRVGTSRPFDVAICTSAFQLRPAAPPSPAVPIISVTAHLASSYLEIGADADVAPASLFLSVKIHHARLHLTQAYGLLTAKDAAPTRGLVFTVYHIAPGKLTVSGCSSLLIWLRAWSLDNIAVSMAGTDDASDGTAAAAASDSTALSPLRPASLRPAPMTYLLLTVGKVRAEASMLDIENINSSMKLSLAQLSCRVVDLGGLAAAPKPFLLSAEVRDLLIESQPDLDGLEGRLDCPKGLKVRLLRLPLAVAALQDVEDEGEDGSITERQRGGGRRRRDSLVDYDSDAAAARDDEDDDELSWGDASSLLAVGHRKRMVNRLELLIQPIRLRFSVQGGRVELIRGHTSLLTVSVQDQFYPTAPLDLFEKGSARHQQRSERHRGAHWSGRWVTQSDIDVGERLVVGASSHAIPYFIDICTLLIKFLQAEISRYPPSIPQARPSAAETAGSVYGSASSRLPSSTAASSDVVDDGSGNMRLTGRMIRLELNSSEERERAVASLVEYALSLTKECEMKAIDDSADYYHSLSPTAILRGEQETLRVLLLDVGKHRLDEEDGRYEYVPIRVSRPYTEGLFLSRLSPPSDDREIVRVPGFVLEMETLEYEYQPVIRSRFLSFWDKAMTVSVDVRHYKFLQSIASSFMQQYSTAVSNVHQQARDMRETAKRAAASQQQQQREEERRSAAADDRQHASQLLQLPLTGSSSTPSNDSTSSRSVKFRLPKIRSTTADSPAVSVRSTSAGAPSTATGGSAAAGDGAAGGGRGSVRVIKSLFQRKQESPIQLYIKDEEKKEQPAIAAAAETVTATKEESKDGTVDDDRKEGPARADAETAGTRAAGGGRQAAAAAVDSEEMTGAAASAQGGGGEEEGGAAGVKLIDPMGVVEFNPAIHVLDNTSSGVSSRKVLELLGMKGDLSIVPQYTHQLTMLMDGLMDACRLLSRHVDTALDR